MADDDGNDNDNDKDSRFVVFPVLTLRESTSYKLHCNSKIDRWTFHNHHSGMKQSLKKTVWKGEVREKEEKEEKEKEKGEEEEEKEKEKEERMGKKRKKIQKRTKK